MSRTYKSLFENFSGAELINELSLTPPENNYDATIADIIRCMLEDGYELETILTVIS